MYTQQRQWYDWLENTKDLLISLINKGNNKITELRAILQRESQNSQVYKHKISQQPENCENRNDPDLVQAFLNLFLRSTHNLSKFKNIWSFS
jgi:hypothetical protein